ncbi:MAG TPA: two-component sensor histidine kinase, partial [Xanthomarina gelatinilytica]|nr:two-component sensor histidine kinase [Xanthomarina gelatinilytica]
LKKETELKEALIKIETQNKLQDQRLRISRDLHDNIGAQLTFIISSLDNLKYGFKLPDNLNDKLKYISEFTSSTIYELRDTIWAMNKSEISFEDLQSRISNFIEKANK